MRIICENCKKEGCYCRNCEYIVDTTEDVNVGMNHCKCILNFCVKRENERALYDRLNKC